MNAEVVVAEVEGGPCIAKPNMVWTTTIRIFGHAEPVIIEGTTQEAAEGATLQYLTRELGLCPREIRWLYRPAWQPAQNLCRTPQRH
jgi:hypothetical protein